jgi:hypothetical protein
MNIYQSDNKVSLEVILADHTMRRFLNTLLMEVLFFTGSQLAASFRGVKPTGPSVHWFDRRIRYFMDQLKEAEYIGQAAADRIPPPTIGTEPIFTWLRDDPLPTEAEARAYADASSRRVPALASHTRTKLYFARSKLCPFLRGLGYRIITGKLLHEADAQGLSIVRLPALDPSDLTAFARQIEDEARSTGTLPTTVLLKVRSDGDPVPFRYVPWPGREAKFQKVLQWYREVESRDSPSSLELAGTHLVAHANLNHLRFTPKFRSAIERGECEFSAYGNLSPGVPDGSFRHLKGHQYELYFLRPCYSNQIEQQVKVYREDHMRLAEECWWM